MIRPFRWKYIDKFRRKFFLKNELRRFVLRSIICNTEIPQTQRYLALYWKSRLIRISSNVQHKSRCVNTGRIWAVSRNSNYSRFVFQREAYKGHLPGFKRASW